MKFIFENSDEYQAAWNSAHAGILYWKKVLQDVKGKICLQVDGTQTHYTEETVIYKMKEAAKILMAVEDSYHEQWDQETETYFWKEGVECYSGIITQVLKLEKNL